MTELPKRQLGRTGLQVTALGYGAMELRGAPRARPTTDAQAETCKKDHFPRTSTTKRNAASPPRVRPRGTHDGCVKHAASYQLA
jgi:hypothetical protein